ncbi:VOC family protein [Ramlibacter sp. WS9]|uniref:VOC family protein n=1 Tax=Ramlibacter sp. WS9 TaxID=1882741 RepID=UPI0013052186|nr:VOC family protein [Ramlibacter sp. WS9]
MFEIIARDQGALQTFYTSVFGWNYQAGSSGFAYVNFPLRTLPLLGGIGQANSSPGFEPGRNFYLLVDDLDAAIARALAAGGSRYMEPTSADGYHFAMVRDPEGNPIGLIKPFSEKPA